LTIVRENAPVPPYPLALTGLSLAELILARIGNRLSGTFRCGGMREFGGTRTLDILDGSFQCTES
jgi:hypothetical protein